ncbi:hypothetical protein LPJ55_004549 [Coemansia sp. RSA 990]|nr:hypothetical protein BX667DRAFT_498319 [Coemansia mojavensis]KAJ1740259.1 hypothetical protein LPJ68_003926 [Coemansia sp. RSA 1086]KAJ1753127.1 hypothetical protein LPJ79_000580 [Coemansia sp. RSA 1821]KAJ1870582.1 hypothetical protein LPJ55_004549 [Coemansia sp. RSA 990]KAJ2650144.1 hypothetical protein IWW40_002690 [Coemansia sp. RSA 1250]
MKVFAITALFASLAIAAPIQGNHEPLSELSLDTPNPDIMDWISKIKEWIQDHKDNSFDEASESGHHGGWGHGHHDWQSFLSGMESLSGLDEEFSHPSGHHGGWHGGWHGGKPSDFPGGKPSDLPGGKPSDLPGGEPSDLPGEEPSEVSESSESSESDTSEAVYSTMDITALNDLLD